MTEIRVVLVDDHNVVRKGLRSYLESFADIRIVGEAASGEALLASLAAWQPDVIVMDLLLPGGIDGLEATRQARVNLPNAQIVALTAYTDDARVVAALRAGAIGYVRKDADPEILLSAVRAAAKGQAIIDPAVAGAMMQNVVQKSLSGNSLTDREMDVLRELVNGRTNREIATSLSISEETVKTHMGNILTKLGLSHRQQVIVYALKEGLVSLDELDPFPDQ
jgi:two-component system, NarL family, response regulator LiaR